MTRWPLPLCAMLSAAAPATAQSYDENPSGRPLYALLDARVTASGGERSWLDGGFGKGRFGGDTRRDTQVRARAVEGDLVWQPHFGWSLDATVAVVAQQGQDQPVDLSEAYLSYRHAPLGAVKLAARVGLFWPPISLEHGGPAWTVTDTITPSAINSWVGEEVKVVGAEGTASAPLGGGRLYGTLAVFGLNDTAGTLLTYRGWALHDEKTTAFSLQMLPPVPSSIRNFQSPRTSPTIELGSSPGFYGKLGWATPTLKLAAFYYDNRGDPASYDNFKQWGWRTRFTDLSVQVKPDAHTILTAQAMAGSTQMGFKIGERYWIDTDFRSAFLLTTRRLGERSSLSARIEGFGTRGHGSIIGPDGDEDGWALTLAGKRRVGEHLTLLGEVLRIDSTRDERTRLGIDPNQRQVIGQLAARVAL